MRVAFNHYAIHKNTIYFYDAKKALICTVDAASGEINYVSEIKNFNAEIKGDTDFSVYNNGKIYILRINGEELIIYNIADNECEYIQLDYRHRPYGNFAYMCVYEDNVYIFPRYGENIIQVKKDNSIREIPYRFKNTKDIVCGQKVGEKVYLFYQDGYEVLEISLQDYAVKTHFVEIEMKAPRTCAHVEKQIFLFNLYGTVYVYNFGENKIDKIKEVACACGANTYYRMIHTEKAIALFPYASDDIVIIDMKSKEVNIYEEYPIDLFYYLGHRKYIGCCEDEDFYYLLGCSDYMLKVDKKTAEFHWIKLKYPSTKELFQAFKCYHINEFREANYSLQDMLNGAWIDSENKCSENSMGKRIWESVKKERRVVG